MPRLSFLLRLSLAALLLAVWQGALLHPLQHVDAAGAFVHVPGKNLPHGGGDKSANALCDAIAAVAACVAGTIPLTVPALAGISLVAPRQAAAPRAAPPPAYRSQAPPVVL